MVLSPVAAVAGVAEGLGWISAGLLATLTGGAFGISPDSIAQLQASTGLQLPEGHRSEHRANGSLLMPVSDGSRSSHR